MKITSLVEELKSCRHYIPKNNNERQCLCPKITAMFTVIYHHQKHSDIVGITLKYILKELGVKGWNGQKWFITASHVIL
jgi:hypothetical protein